MLRSPLACRTPVQLVAGALRDLRGVAVREREALGRIVPGLLCGEESSVLVFAGERDRLGQAGWLESRALFDRIGREEEEHALLLALLREHVPVPGDLPRIQARSRRFLMRIGAAGGVAEHFARIAELDACVCMLMSELLDTPVARNDAMRALFRLIRADERRHVRTSRAHVETLTGEAVAAMDARAWVREELTRLLAYVADSLEVLSIDPDRLFRRIRTES